MVTQSSTMCFSQFPVLPLNHLFFSQHYPTTHLFPLSAAQPKLMGESVLLTRINLKSILLCSGDRGNAVGLKKAKCISFLTVTTVVWPRVPGLTNSSDFYVGFIIGTVYICIINSDKSIHFNPGPVFVF